jgi:CBS domain-containing protein
MPLNYSVVETFLIDHRESLQDRSLLRHDRYRILSELRDRLESSLKDHEAFESELHTLVIDKIERARQYEELLECHMRAIAGVQNYFLEEDSVIDVHDLFRTIRDSITVRVLKLVEEEMERDGYGRPPVEYVWIGMGSEGRDEQTLLTDQDNMIVYDIYEDEGDGFVTQYLRDQCHQYCKDAGLEDSSKAIGSKRIPDYYFKLFSEKAVERLHQAGFERCKGNVMSSNEKWRGSRMDWKERLEERLTFERGIFEALDVVILTDARAITGKKELLDTLMGSFFRLLTDNKHVMKDFIESAVLMPTALSFFGNFKTEKSGEYKDMLNIKLLGWAPLILAVRMAALSQGIFERNTLRRIRLLRQANVIKKEMENDLVEAYLIFVRFRLMNQINNRKNSLMHMNYLRPDMLGPEEQERLRKAMRAVETLQKYIQEILLFGQAP